LLVSKLEKIIGIEVYATRSPGIGGVIRQFVEDFVVEEVLVDGSKAKINQSEGYVKRGVLGSSTAKERYLLCVLVKRNWDMFRAIKTIAKQLGINPKSIQIAGIKDAKAVTAQHITVEDLSAEEIQKVQIKDIKIRPVGYLRNKLSPYYLLGNNFHLTIRAINHSKFVIKKRITKTITELETIGGVPNFFGHQRFGTTRPITHLVGKAFVKRNFKKAALIFLAKPSSHEHPESRQTRRQLQATHDFKQAWKEFPKQLPYERIMLKHLAEKPDDYVGAFRRLPNKLLELFPQAYQAYLFNRFLSGRVKNGLPLNMADVGDYVVNVERSGLPMLNMYKIASAQALDAINKAIKTGRMRVAIPLVGFKQRLSQGFQGELEKQIMTDEGITLENFKIEAMPEISTKGELRTAVTPINNFLMGEILADSTNLHKNKAKVSFTLYRGSYATTLLREIIKSHNPIKSGF